MQARAVIAFVALLIPAQVPAPPPVQITETITVSAREAKAINDGVRALKGSDDPFIKTTVADNILKLANAMAASGRTYQIGPLTDREQALINLGAYLDKHAVAGAPIRLQVRRADSTEGQRSETFTRSSLITFFADLATGNLFKERLVQTNKRLVVARMIEDLNAQEHDLIPEREILAGMLRGFRHEDPRGVITSRVQDVADAIAADTVAYDFVPPDQQKGFGRQGAMSDDAFKKVMDVRKGLVNVVYERGIYAASVEHFVWFFIRFLLPDESHPDWYDGGRGVALGGKILDYLAWQLQLGALDAVIRALDAAGAPGPNDIRLGDFRSRGPGLDVMNKAPGLSQKPSALGPDYRVLVVSPARKAPELRTWLEARAADLRNKLKG